MSNQQPGYPQQPQYGGYPPPPPPRKRTGLIVLSVVAALVLLAGVIVAVTRIGGSDDDTADVPTAPSAAPSVTASRSWPTGGPTPSAKPCGICFPGVKLPTVIAQLTSKGFACRSNDATYTCLKGQHNTVRFTSGLDPTVIADFKAQTFSRGPGRHPQGRTEVVAAMKSDLQLLTPLLLVDPSARQQIAAWFTKNLGTCSGPLLVKVARYTLSCSRPTAVTAAGKQPSTSWDNHVHIYGREIS